MFYCVAHASIFHMRVSTVQSDAWRQKTSVGGGSDSDDAHCEPKIIELGTRNRRRRRLPTDFCAKAGAKIRPSFPESHGRWDNDRPTAPRTMSIQFSRFD